MNIQKTSSSYRVWLLLLLLLVDMSKVVSLEELVEIKKKNVLVVSRVHETIMHIFSTKMTKTPNLSTSRTFIRRHNIFSQQKEIHFFFSLFQVENCIQLSEYF